MNKSTFIVFILCLTQFTYSQDVEILFVPTWTYPQSGCDVGGATDQIKVAIKNNGPGSTLGNYIYIKYQIDGGVIIVDSLSALGPGSLWQFDFTNNSVDLSACGDTFNILTWIEFALDGNPSNDTLEYEFINFCTPDAGTLLEDSTYLNTSDLDTLVLINSVNATNYLWQYSTDLINWSNVVDDTTDLPISYQDTLGYYRVIVSNPECPKDTSDMVEIRYFDPTLSILEELEDVNIKLYPNPTNDYIYIETEEQLKFQLYSMNGSLILEEEIQKGSTRISLLDIGSGSYIVNIIRQSKRFIKKLIKQD